MTAGVRLRDIGGAYGGLTGKTKADFGSGTASFITFLEVINDTRLKGRDLGRVQVASSERQNRVRHGDLLFNGSSETPNEVALSAVVDFVPGADTYLNSFCFGFRLRKKFEIDPVYLAYFFRSSAGRELIAALAQGATRYNIATSKFLDVELDLPPLKRQGQIVESLRDVEEQIAALERIFTKKQAIRQGVMLQLLTGRIRLPGFDSAWVEVELGDLLGFKNGLNKGSKYFGLGTPIVNFMDVMKGSIITSEDVIGRVTLTRDEIKRFSAKRGDLFFTRTSETVEEVGTAATLVDDIPNATFSGFILRGRPKAPNIDSRFVAYLFQLDTIRQQVRASATYTTRALTNGRSLGRVFIRLPEDAEQRAIANVIEDADREIALLRGRVDKARNVKQGMMQELLTGRTRLPVQGAAA
jgi:type I restriction enzyme, S subunit